MLCVESMPVLMGTSLQVNQLPEGGRAQMDIRLVPAPCVPALAWRVGRPIENDLFIIGDDDDIRIAVVQYSTSEPSVEG